LEQFKNCSLLRTDFHTALLCIYLFRALVIIEGELKLDPEIQLTDNLKPVYGPKNNPQNGLGLKTTVSKKI